MSEASPWVIEVTETSFDAEVLERSHDIPVLVDFWAPWCGPCRTLGPVLETITHESKGQFLLAKVDTEAHPSLGTRYQIRSIPAVKLFSGGRPIAEFVGALPPSQVRQFMRTHLPSETDVVLEEARSALAEGDVSTARQRFRDALELDPELPSAHLALAKLGWAETDPEITRHHLDAISPRADEAEEASHVRDALELCARFESESSVDALRDRLGEHPDDVATWLQLGCRLLRAGSHRASLEAFLEVVKRDRKYDDDIGRKAMLTVFGLLGRRHPLRDEFVRQLQIYT